MKKRLLLVIPASVMGGAEVLSRTLIDGLNDITTTVVTQDAIANCFTAVSGRVRVFEEADLNAPYDYSLSNVLRYGRFLAKVISQEEPTVVLSVMQAASIFLACVSITHPYSLKNTRRFGSIHGHIGQYFRFLGRNPTLGEITYLRLMALRLHGIIVPSKGVAHDLTQLVPTTRRKTHVIYNGVDLAAIRSLSQEESTTKQEVYRIVMVARLSPQKDHETLFKAFAKLSVSHPTELVLIGEGEERERLGLLASQLGIVSQVTFVGYLSNPYPLIASADIFVLSSRFEGFGLVLVEAMALRRAVVATDCPSGPAEIIRDGIDGYLVPQRDVDLLYAKMSHLLDDEDARRALGQRGQYRSEFFSLQKMIDNYRKVLFS